MIKYNIDITKYLDSTNRINTAITSKQWFRESYDYETILKETSWINELNPDLKITSRMTLIRDNITEFNKCKHCSKDIPFYPDINKTSIFCSKSCARIFNNDKQIQTTQNKAKIQYENSDIIDVPELKTRLIELKESDKNIKLSYILLNREGLAKSVDYYIKEDLELSEKANMIIRNEFELKVCKREECSNKVKNNKHDYCSVSCQSQDNVETRAETYLNKTGFTHPHYNPEVIESRKMKCIEKWGVEVPQLHPDVLRKTQQTCLEKYGVRHFNQLGTKVNFPNFSFKQYKLPSGKIIPYQGYEDRLLDELLLEYEEDEIINERENMPEIWYFDKEGIKRRYFPDVYIPKTNTIYEVKSEYTLNRCIEINELKFQAVKDAGFNFELRVY